MKATTPSLLLLHAGVNDDDDIGVILAPSSIRGAAEEDDDDERNGTDSAGCQPETLPASISSLESLVADILETSAAISKRLSSSPSLSSSLPPWQDFL